MGHHPERSHKLDLTKQRLREWAIFLKTASKKQYIQVVVSRDQGTSHINSTLYDVTILIVMSCIYTSSKRILYAFKS
jgi:hypothetical protein